MTKSDAAMRIGVLFSDAPNAWAQPGPVIELTRISIVQRELKLCLVQPRTDGDVLRGLHVERDALDLREAGPQPCHHLLNRLALIMRLELNENPAIIERRKPAARTHRAEARSSAPPHTH
jgi:hypothetical protein